MKLDNIVIVSTSVATRFNFTIKDPSPGRRRLQVCIFKYVNGKRHEPEWDYTHTINTYDKDYYEFSTYVSLK